MPDTGQQDQPHTATVPPWRLPGDDRDALLEWRNAVMESERADGIDAEAAALEIKAARLRAEAVAVRRAANARALAAVGKLAGLPPERRRGKGT